MSAKLSQEEVLRRCRNIHGDKYDYSEAVYTASFKKMNIICPNHGLFRQTYTSHINTVGCMKCAKDIRINKKYLSQEKALQRCIDAHNGLFKYPNFNYTGIEGKIEILCKKHGFFHQRYNSHVYKKSGCLKCRNEKIQEHNNNQKLSQEKALEKCIIAHGIIYDYSLFKYKDRTEKIKIICKEHGMFSQYYTAHVNGHGCRKCAHQNHSGIYNYKLFEKYPSIKKLNSIYYTILLSNSTEKFIKKGITTQTPIMQRLKVLPYNIEILNKEQITLFEAFTKEQNEKEKYKHLKYKPKIYFGGHTECFTLEILKGISINEKSRF